MWSDLTLGPFLQGQTSRAKVESAYNSLIIVLEVWDDKPTHMESWAGNLFVLIFDLGPLLQGQMRIAKLKSAYNSLIWLEILCMSLFNNVPSRDTLHRDIISSCKMLFIFETTLVVLFWWIHLPSGHGCILGLVLFCIFNIF